jgi:hypothetical protein
MGSPQAIPFHHCHHCCRFLLVHIGSTRLFRARHPIKDTAKDNVHHNLPQPHTCLNRWQLQPRKPQSARPEQKTGQARGRRRRFMAELL